MTLGFCIAFALIFLGEFIMSNRTKYVLWAFVLAMLLGFVALVLSPGCQTVKGVAGDSAWILQKTADNIQPEDDR